MREQEGMLRAFCGGYWRKESLLLDCIGKSVSVRYFEPSSGKLSYIVSTLAKIEITALGLRLFLKGGYSNGYLIPRGGNVPKNEAIIGVIQTEKGEYIYQKG